MVTVSSPAATSRRSFGAWLRQQRRALDLTQAQLADRVGCARVTIRKLEAEELRPSRPLAELLAEALSIPPTAREAFVRAARSSEVSEAWRPPDVSALTATPRHNLPLQLTSFVGRADEMEDVQRLLASSRLLTLTGPGGIGKTRLALQVANELVDQYRDGVWLVDFAPVSDPALVPQTVATALGLGDRRSSPLLAILSEYLRTKHLLMLLDNCEHLLEACAGLAEELLRTCAGLRTLATSRAALGIAGETAYVVPSLSLPDVGELSLDALAGVEATHLFIDRARAAQPSFALTNRNASAVAQVCKQLDGMPLAIELAAARVKGLSVEQIAARLNDRFRLLTGGSRTALPRHRTLGATIDWSYQLLREEERVLLRRLAVFAGGWTLEGAESVCAGSGLEARDILDLLSQLVDKSLVVAETKGAEPRYHMLETIRLYALAKLLDAEESEQFREQHFAYFLRLAERTEPLLTTGQRTEWIPHLEVEHDNFRAALEWALERDPERARWLAGVLRWFWFFGDHLSEARAWYARVLGPGERPRTKGTAIALCGASKVSQVLYLFDEARPMLEQNIVLCQELGNDHWLAESVFSLAYAFVNLGQYGDACGIFEVNEALLRASANPFVLALALTFWGRARANCRDDYAAAKELHEESVAVARASQDPIPLGVAFTNLGHLATQQGDYDAARRYYLEGLTWRRRAGTRWHIAMSAREAAGILSLQGEYSQAQSLYEETISLSRAEGDPLGEALATYRLGYCAMYQAKNEQAATLFAVGLDAFRGWSDRMGIAGCLLGFAELRRLQGQPERATRLLAFADVFLKSNKRTWRTPVEHVEYTRSVAAARAQLGDATFNAAWEAGSQMTLVQAVALALETPV